MTPMMRRLVAGFLATFVLLSLAPYAPEGIALARRAVPVVAAALARLAQAGGAWLSTLDPGGPAGDLLLVAAASLTLLLLTLLLRRHRAEAPRRRPAARPARAAVARRSADPVAPPSSALSRRLREAARDGERVPEVARRFRLSQDAVRVAIGRAAPTPAAPTGKSFRSRQAVLPARPRATPVPSRRSPYKALA